jgi:hypothetical protein
MTGRSSHRSSTTRQRAGLARTVGCDAASLLANIGEVRALVAERTFASRDGGVWNTFGIGFRVTGGASPFGTISDAVCELGAASLRSFGGAGGGSLVTPSC